MKKSDEPRADGGEGNTPSEASIIPPSDINKGIERILNYIKAAMSYIDKVFNSVLRLNYEIVRVSTQEDRT